LNEEFVGGLELGTEPANKCFCAALFVESQSFATQLRWALAGNIS
jgi:hypothetical protein